MAVRCRMCGSFELRPSHLRLEDLAHLLLLRYPVRCRICRLRDYVFVPLVRGMKLHARPRHKNSSHPKNAEASH